MIDRLELLKRPFDVVTHSKSFVCYCEVLIHSDGRIEYAVPSHDAKLRQIYAKKHNLSDADTLAICKDKGADYIDYLMVDTGCMFVWYNHLQNAVNLTDKQRKALSMLLEHKCISDECLNDISDYSPYNNAIERREAFSKQN